MNNVTCPRRLPGDARLSLRFPPASSTLAWGPQATRRIHACNFNSFKYYYIIYLLRNLTYKTYNLSTSWTRSHIQVQILNKCLSFKTPDGGLGNILLSAMSNVRIFMSIASKVIDSMSMHHGSPPQTAGSCPHAPPNALVYVFVAVF